MSPDLAPEGLRKDDLAVVEVAGETLASQSRLERPLRQVVRGDPGAPNWRWGHLPAKMAAMEARFSRLGELSVVASVVSVLWLTMLAACHEGLHPRRGR